GVLRQAVQQDAWDGPRGKVYVLYRIPLSVVHSEIMRRMPYGLDVINPFGAAEAEATDQLAAFLDARLHQRLTAAARERPGSSGAPAGPRPPEWLELGRHRRYPGGEFLSAIGIGSDFLEAEQAAQVELAARIEADLARAVRTRRGLQAGSVLAENLGWLAPGAFSCPAEDLVAARTAEAWHDPTTDTHYALGVLDRAKASQTYRNGVHLARERSESLHASGLNHRKADNHAASLKDLLDAFVAAQEAVECQLKGIVVAPIDESPNFEGMVAEPILSQIGSDLELLLKSITITKIAGDAQWMPPGTPPKEPLEVRVIAGEPPQGVPQLPLRLRMGYDGEVVGRALTDAEGAIRWRVNRAPPADVSRPAIVAELDLAAWAPAANLQRLTVPQAAFTYVLRSRENTLLALHIREDSSEGAEPAQSLAETLREALTAEGFRLVAESDVSGHFETASLTPESSDGEVLEAYATLRQSLGPGRFLLVVIGEVRSRLVEATQTPTGKLYIVYCPFEIRVLDSESSNAQQAVLAVSGTGKDAYLEKEAEARRRARVDAAAEAAAQLLAGLRQKLGRAASGP
ncbi:MAG: hypothetical protein ACYTFZ_06700, partial [Planctomycetota bacterium]